jgi:hypothetical protein
MSDHPPSDHPILCARALQAADQLDYAASLIRDLVGELKATDNRIEAMGHAAEGRFDEALAGLPGPFREWLGAMVEQHRDDPEIAEGVRRLGG